MGAAEDGGSSFMALVDAMSIRLLGRDEIPLIWQIDRREIVEMSITYVMEN